MTTAICPGSFDPVTVGHVDIIRRARKMFDHVIVAVLVNPTKHPRYSLEDRIGLMKRETKDIAWKSWASTACWRITPEPGRPRCW